MNTNVNIHQGRFGYHPCNFELFQKLKRLHKWYWQTMYDFHRWHRWWRKQPQNRHGAEPKYCAVFVDDTTWYKAIERHGERGYRVYPKMVTDRGLVALYQLARIPQREPVPTFEPKLVEQIAELYSRAASYFEV